MTSLVPPGVVGANAIELSHDANAAYLSALSAVHDLVKVSTEGAASAVNDPRGFALAVRDLATQIHLSFEAFVGAVASDTRSKKASEVVFPWSRLITAEKEEAPREVPVPHPKTAEAALTSSRHQTPPLATAVGSSIAMSFDALARLTKADEGMVLQVITRSSGADLQAVCLFGTQRSPASVRFSGENGVIGSVLRTGLGLNIAPDQPSATYSAMLCFPIFSVEVRSEPIGVVILERKVEPIEGFSRHEELLLGGFCQLLPKLMTGYGIQSLAFDAFEVLKDTPHLASSYKQLGKESPVAEKSSSSMVIHSPREAPSRYADAGRISHMLLDGCGSSVGTSRGAVVKLAALASVQPRSLMVLQTTHHSHFTKSRIKPLHSPLTLVTQNVVDVADYIATIEECWRRSTDDVQALTAQQASNSAEVQDRRRTIKELQARIARLEQVANKYKERYEDLRLELMVACEAPVGDDTPV